MHRKKLKTLQDIDKILWLENNLRGGISSVMGDRYIKSDDNKQILYIDATNLYGHSLSEPLPYDENKVDNNVKLENTLNPPDNSDIGHLVEVDLGYPDIIKKQNIFHLLLWIENLFLLFLVIIWKRLYLILKHKLEN